MEPESNDPAAEHAFMEVVPKPERLGMLEGALEQIEVCVAKGRPGSWNHSECEPFARLDECFALVKKHLVGADDYMPRRGKRKEPLTVLQFLFGKFVEHDCPFGRETDGVLLKGKEECAEYFYARAKKAGVPFNGVTLPPADLQIGRASCRERVKISVFTAA